MAQPGLAPDPLNRDKPLREIVLDEPETARVFQELGIDYCCKGELTVAEACARKGIDPARVWRALEHAQRHHIHELDDPRRLSTPSLVERIVDRHHAYLRRALPEIARLVGTVARVHGEAEPHLRELERSFLGLREIIEPHLEDEEGVLFPALLAEVPDAELIGREVRRMSDDHLAVGATLERIRALAHGFVVPAWGCTSMRALMFELQALESDLLTHIHLENHVLAPRFYRPMPQA
jgi:regulator of cell morphogenesis and NO signaling